MSVFALTDATIFAGGYDLTQDSNKVTLNVKADELDVTTFGLGGYRKRIGGLKDARLTHEGFAGYADPDNTMFADLAQQRVCTVSPTGADQSVAYFLNARRFSYVPLDSAIGDPAKFAGEVAASDGVGAVRGQLLLPKGTRSGATNGTATQLGALSATQSLYTSIHVFSAGTTCTVIVESATANTMVGAVTRSSTVVSAQGGTFVTPVAGPITDTWWRVRLASVTGSFSLAVAVGIR